MDRLDNSFIPTIWTIILNWNGYRDTLECLESCLSTSIPNHILIVDNGSTDRSVDMLSQTFPHIPLIVNRENLGYAEGNNVGIEYALDRGADYIFVLNNDSLIDRDIFCHFLAAFKTYPQAAILGSTVYSYHNRSYLDHLGGNWNSHTGTFDLVGKYARADQEEWSVARQLDYVCGVALFAKADVFRKVGRFESRFFLFWEESDFCFRALRQGYASYVCPQAKVWHKGSASFIGGKPHVTYFWWRGRLLWIERNCLKKERIQLTCRVLIPEGMRLIKLYLIKQVEFFLITLFRIKKKREEKKKRLRNYRAALSGMKDYLFGRFGSGPNWIFRKGA